MHCVSHTHGHILHKLLWLHVCMYMCIYVHMHMHMHVCIPRWASHAEAALIKAEGVGVGASRTGPR